MIDIKPWMEPGFPSTLCDTFKLDGLETYVIIRFPIPLLGTIHIHGLNINGKSMVDIRKDQIMEMIENNIKSKDFVFEWSPENKLNPLPYTINLFMYDAKLPELDEPHNFYSPKVCALIVYNRVKYIEMAQYPFEENKVCEDYIRHGDLNIRLGKLKEEMK